MADSVGTIRMGMIGAELDRAGAQARARFPRRTPSSWRSATSTANGPRPWPAAPARAPTGTGATCWTARTSGRSSSPCPPQSPPGTGGRRPRPRAARLPRETDRPHRRGRGGDRGGGREHRHRLRGRLPVACARPARRTAALLAGQQIGLLVGTSIGPTQSRPWFVDMRAGGGNLLERGSHHLDLARTVAGEVASVQAAAGADPAGPQRRGSRGHRRRPDDACSSSPPAPWRPSWWPGPSRASRARYGLDIIASDATLEARPRPRLHPHRRERRAAG